MIEWYCHTSMRGLFEREGEETWEIRVDGKAVSSYKVFVRIGKDLDVLGLKGTDLQEISDYAAFLQKTADSLYSPTYPRKELTRCPCCTAEEANFHIAMTVFGVPYHQCRVCGHVFVKMRPSDETLKRVFSESDQHSCAYTDPASLEIRLQQIVFPKLDWLLDVYRKKYGVYPSAVLDVGAGGGHFVAGCLRHGLAASGLELSRSSREFASQNFDINLSDLDFLKSEDIPGNFEVITFWGLLEYTPEPGRFIERASKYLTGKNGLLVVEVPRFHCLGTHVQKQFPQNVARHMDPTSHVNCFSDASLAMILVKNGFTPVAAWYFGMDIYEFLVQLAIRLNNPELLPKLAGTIPALQGCLDSARLCDDLIIAAVPESKKW